MIRSRLRHRLGRLGIDTLDQYTEQVRNDKTGGEFQEMISALTTNVTGFFREPHHFQIIEDTIVNSLEDKVKAGKPVRIWSAGCSNGQEAYSLAIHFLEHNNVFSQDNFKILATDIDTEVIKFAKAGIYSHQQVSDLSADIKKKYFDEPVNSNAGDFYSIKSKVKNLITFKRLNLMDDWPMKGTFDIIFCRNVVIYFDAKTQADLWRKFDKLLDHSGLMCVGHSERISDPTFKSIGATAYAKSTSLNTKLHQPR